MVLAGIRNLIASILIAGGTGDYEPKRSFVDLTAARPIIFTADANDYSRGQKVHAGPRAPAISDDWRAFIERKNVGPDFWADYKSGNVYVTHRASDTIVRITDANEARTLDIYEHTLVYDDREDLYVAYLDSLLDSTDSNNLDFGNLVEVEDGVFRPNNLECECITEKMDEKCVDPQIDGDQISCRVGAYDPEDVRIGKNSWKTALRYRLRRGRERRGRFYPISNEEGNKWKPSISGKYVAYAVHKGVPIVPDPNGTEYTGNWNVFLYHLGAHRKVKVDPTELEELLGENGFEWYCRSVAVYDDPESGQAIIAYERWKPDEPCGIRIRRAEVRGSKVIIDPAYNPHGIPEDIILGVGVRTGNLDMHGVPGQGIYLAFEEYTQYGTDIKGINFKDPEKEVFDVHVGDGWQQGPKVWVDPNGSVDVTWMHRNFDADELDIGLNLGTLSTLGLEFRLPQRALVSNSIIKRPNPLFCGDIGTKFRNTDVDRNCFIDFNDLRGLGNNWAYVCNAIETWCGDADINKDRIVNFKDLALLADDFWLQYDP